MRSPGLAALVSDGAFMAHESMLDLVERHGGNDRWNVDLQERVLTLTKGDSVARFGVQLLGSAAPGPRSWLWSWANPSYGGAVVAAAEATRALGEQYAIPELTHGEVPFPDDAEEDVPGMALSYDLSLAARAVNRSWYAYNGDAGGGTRAWFLLDGIELPAPSGPRVLRVLGEAISALDVPDHRRAVTSYAAFRGLPFDGTALTVPEGTIRVGFDDRNLLTTLDGEFGGQA